MKKLILLSVFFITVSVLCLGETPASLKKVITSDMIIQPDPENPFQGTWFYESSRNNFWVTIIEGMTGTVYLRVSPSRQWKRQSVFIIEKKDDVYVIPSPLGGDSQLILTNNNNLLTILNTTYERYEN